MRQEQWLGVIVGVALVAGILVFFGAPAENPQVVNDTHLSANWTFPLEKPSDNGDIWVGNNTTIHIGNATCRIYAVNGTIVLEGVKLK